MSLLCVTGKYGEGLECRPQRLAVIFVSAGREPTGCRLSGSAGKVDPCVRAGERPYSSMAPRSVHRQTAACKVLASGLPADFLAGFCIGCARFHEAMEPRHGYYKFVFQHGPANGHRRGISTLVYNTVGLHTVYSYTHILLEPEVKRFDCRQYNATNVKPIQAYQHSNFVLRVT